MSGESVPEIVVYVHGLWLNGHESVLLRRRLQRDFGYDVRTFRYPSRSYRMSQITADLRLFVAALPATTVHFVGHSLGGLVILRLLEHWRAPPGRVVFLATPGVASRAAMRAGRLRLLAALMGPCIAEELVTEHPRCWTAHERPLGIIAGTRALGLGRLFAAFGEENDGTVAVSETRLPGATDHLVLPVSHMGMLVSDRVARAVGTFLRQGGFASVRDAAGASLSSARNS